MEKKHKNKFRFLNDKLLKMNIDGYILPSTDEYLNEYVPENHLRLKWLTGFSGSNGLCFVLKNRLIFFTDGRYLLQAEEELVENIEIIDISKENIFQWIERNLDRANLCIAIDTKINSISFVKRFLEICKLTKNKVFLSEDIIIDDIWSREKKQKSIKAYLLEKKYSGLSAYNKIKSIEKHIKGFDSFVITSPESIAWLLNLRGGDLKYTPIVFGRLIMKKKVGIKLFIDIEKVSSQTIKRLKKELDIQIFDELEFEKELTKGIRNKKVLLEKYSPFHFLNILESNEAKVSLKIDPCKVLKSVKNDVEINLSRKAHFYDGIALANFFCWLDNVSSKLSLDEIVVAKKLEKFRKKNKKFVSLSFPTISASSSNSAIIHYQPSGSKVYKLRLGELFLCDSGAQYIHGTTDVTRTIIFGKKEKVNTEIKNLYTRVLIGHLNISMLRFPENTKGVHIDSFARQSLWEIGEDYGHGTGHGVGSFLGVHEGPQSISKSLVDINLRPGMIISNEPGFYKNDKFGIRIENLICVKKSKIKNFLEFETLTLAPYKRNLIEVSLLNNNQIEWINNYHENVYKKLNRHLNAKVSKWLFDETRPINL
ncbi:aminopeptidase P family protein [Rickettsiales bacterium]|nr:aminopeptidase P family protein [Rickettsiales bacterium]